MRVSILSDIDWETKVDHATKVLQLREAFGDDFGTGLSRLVVILNCRDQSLRHKQRIRHEKASATLYIDVMLDHDYFVQATHAGRRAKIAEQVIAQVQPAIEKRNIEGFSSKAFLAKLEEVLQEQLNGPHATRFDHLCLERAYGA